MSPPVIHHMRTTGGSFLSQCNTVFVSDSLKHKQMHQYFVTISNNQLSSVSSCQQTPPELPALQLHVVQLPAGPEWSSIQFTVHLLVVNKARCLSATSPSKSAWEDSAAGNVLTWLQPVCETLQSSDGKLCILAFMCMLLWHTTPASVTGRQVDNAPQHSYSGQPATRLAAVCSSDWPRLSWASVRRRSPVQNTLHYNTKGSETPAGRQSYM